MYTNTCLQALYPLLQTWLHGQPHIYISVYKNLYMQTHVFTHIYLNMFTHMLWSIFAQGGLKFDGNNTPVLDNILVILTISFNGESMINYNKRHEYNVYYHNYHKDWYLLFVFISVFIRWSPAVESMSSSSISLCWSFTFIGNYVNI